MVFVLGAEVLARPLELPMFTECNEGSGTPEYSDA